MASLLGCLLALLVGCGGIGDATAPTESEASPFGPTGIPPHLRAGRGGPGAAGGASVSASVAIPGATPEEDIVWTDPDDPDSEIPELDSLLAKPARGPWEQSEAVARRRAVREGKCMLIWFTDSQRSPTRLMLSLCG